MKCMKERNITDLDGVCSRRSWFDFVNTHFPNSGMITMSRDYDQITEL